jgi:hypothetical protein
MPIKPIAKTIFLDVAWVEALFCENEILRASLDTLVSLIAAQRSRTIVPRIAAWLSRG